jgi:branched-chain amino acid transport system substrate-binding protein
VRSQGHKRVASCAVGALALVVALGACSSSKKASTGGTAAPSGGSGSSPAASGPTINIGLIASLSGPQASSSDQGATVAPAWAAWINANGGIAGHPVKVFVEDDQNSPATAQSDEQDLESKGVVAIIASSDNFVPAYDAAAIAKGIPVISGTANVTDWYTKAGMFPTPTGVLPGLAAQIAVAVKYGHATKFANLYCAEIAACAQSVPVQGGYAKAAGIQYTSLAVSSTAPSYTAQCVQLQQEHVDYAQLNFATAAAVKFVQDCQAQNYNPTWGSSEQAAGSSFASLQNFTMYGPAYAFPSAAPGAPVATFTSAMQKYAKDGNWKEGTASFTWDGLQVLAKAIQDANVSPSAPVTAQNVLTGLYSFKNENLGGELANGLTYTQGKPVGFAFNPCYFVVGMKGGKVTAPSGLTPQCPASSGQG